MSVAEEENMSAWELEIQVGLLFFSFSGSLTQGQMFGCFSPACEFITSAPWRVSPLKHLPSHLELWGQSGTISAGSLKHHQPFLGALLG